MEMEQSDFDTLLLRYVTGQASEEEKRKMDAWLDAVGDEPERMQYLSKEDEAELYRRITSNVFTEEDVLELKSRLEQSPAPEQETVRSRSGWISGIAASVLLLIAAAAFVMFFKPSLFNEVLADRTLQKVILDDGSVITYNPGARLSHYLEGEQRVADFSGEAFFEIAPDASKPFVIRCDGVVVKVLGTSFRIVSHDATDFTMYVVHGRVEVAARSGGPSVVVGEREMIRFRGASFQKSVIGEEEVADVTDGVDYQLRFQKEHLRDVLNRLEAKYNVTFTLQNREVGRCRITVDLTGYSLEESMKILQEILPVDYRREGSTIGISGSGC